MNRCLILTTLSILIVTSFLIAQQPEMKPRDTLNPPGINISIDGEKKPDGDKTKTTSTTTVAVPDTAFHMPNNARAKPKIEPTGTKPNQKWCESVELSDGILIFKGIVKDGENGDAYTPIMDKEFVEKLKLICDYDFMNAKTENIKFFQQQKDNEKIRGHLIVEIKSGKEIISAMILIEGNFLNDDVLGRPNIIKGKILSNGGEIFIGADGTQISATEDWIIINFPGKDGTKHQISLDKLVEGDSPPMVSPRVWIENGWFSISDEIMKDEKGREMKVSFRVFPKEDKYEYRIDPISSIVL